MFRIAIISLFQADKYLAASHLCQGLANIGYYVYFVGYFSPFDIPFQYPPFFFQILAPFNIYLKPE